MLAIWETVVFWCFCTACIMMAYHQFIRGLSGFQLGIAEHLLTFILAWLEIKKNTTLHCTAKYMQILVIYEYLSILSGDNWQPGKRPRAIIRMSIFFISNPHWINSLCKHFQKQTVINLRVFYDWHCRVNDDLVFIYFTLQVHQHATTT